MRNPANFLGREQELATLAAHLTHERLVTILGVGGIGKTCLAQAYARRASVPVHFVDLGESHDRGTMLDAIADALGGRLAALRTAGVCLVVLDNVEQLLAHATVIGDLVESAPDARFLVTSRERLRLSREVVLELGALDEAALLFAERLRARDPRWSPGPTELACIDTLVASVDRIPLAVELLAERAALLGLAVVAACEPRQHLSARGPLDAPERHRSLRAAFDGSWDALTADERSVLVAATAFRGGFSALDVTALAPPGIDVLAAIEGLRAKALVSGTADAPLLRLLFVVRELVAERVDEPARAALRLAHARLYAGKAREVRGAVGLEWDNFEAALGTLLEVDRHAASELLFVMAETALRSGRLAMVETRCATLLDGADREVDRARLLVLRARVARREGRLHDAEADFDAAMAIVSARGDAQAQALMLRQRGLRLARAARLDDAIASVAEAARLCPPSGGAYDVLGLSSALRQAGDAVRARLVLERYLAGAVSDGDRGLAENELALAHLEGASEEALQAASRALDIFRRLGWSAEEARAHLFMGIAHQLARAPAAAERAFLDAIAAAERAGGASAATYARGYLGILAFEAGELEAADAHLAAARPPDGGHIALFAAYRASVAAARDDLPTMRALARESAREDVPPILRRAIAFHGVHAALADARHARRRGDTQAAATALSHALTCMRDDQARGDVMLARRIACAALGAYDGLDITHELPTLAIHETGAWFALGRGEPVDCTRNANVRRALRFLAESRLAEPGVTVHFDRLVNLIWEGEAMLASAGRNRLRVTIAALRKAGLRDLILTDPAGYRLDERAVVWMEHDEARRPAMR